VKLSVLGGLLLLLLQASADSATDRPYGTWRWCTLAEHGDWAVRADPEGRMHLFLAPRPFHVPDSDLICELHPRSKISVQALPANITGRGGV